MCNFGRADPEFERLYFNPRSVQSPPPARRQREFEQLADFIAPELVGTVIDGLHQVHTLLGPGFIYRIYANAVYHELLLRGLDVLSRREYQVIYRNQPVGEIKFAHLQIDNRLMVFPVAVTDVNNLNIPNLKAWMHVQKIPVGILANFYPTQLEFMMLRVRDQRMGRG